MTERGQRTGDEFGSLFEELSLEQFREAVHSLFFLVHQFRSAVGLPEPCYIVPDNSVLQDLRRGPEQKRRLPRYVAIRGLAHFLKNYVKLDTRIVITPTIFFESIGMRELSDKSQYQEVLRQFKNDLEPLGLPIMLSRIADYREARKLGSLILRDARHIIKTLRDIKDSQWDICLQEGNRKYPIKIPMTKAQELLPSRIKLRYFNEWYVRIILGGIIEKAILESHANSKAIRQMFLNKDHLISSSLLKIKKGQIKGLGDIEIFQYCDIRSQFRSKMPYTYVGLTFDRNLAETLRMHSNLIVRSEEVTGEDDENSLMKKSQSYVKDLKRLTDFDRAQETFQRNYCDFLDDIKPVLVSLEDKLQQ